MSDVGRARTIWYPTATTRRLAEPGGGTWTLGGTIHARPIGGATTTCGLVALQWPMQFYRQFDPDQDASCVECCAVDWSFGLGRAQFLEGDL